MHGLPFAPIVCAIDSVAMASAWRACSYRIEPLLDARCESMEPASIVDHKTGTLRLHNKATPFATVGLRL